MIRFVREDDNQSLTPSFRKLTGSERNSVIARVLHHPEVLALDRRLEELRHYSNLEDATATEIDRLESLQGDFNTGIFVVIPYSDSAMISFSKFDEKTNVAASVFSDKTFSILQPGKPDKTVELLDMQESEHFLSQLARDSKFFQFEDRLDRMGYKIDVSKGMVVIDPHTRRGAASIWMQTDQLRESDLDQSTPVDGIAGVFDFDLDDNDNVTRINISSPILDAPAKREPEGDDNTSKAAQEFGKCLIKCLGGILDFIGPFALELIMLYCATSCGICFRLPHDITWSGCAVCASAVLIGSGYCIWTCLDKLHSGASVKLTPA